LLAVLVALMTYLDWLSLGIGMGMGGLLILLAFAVQVIGLDTHRPDSN
jgi:hypothetical protein